MNTVVIVLTLISVMIGAIVQKLGVPFWLAFPMFLLLVMVLWMVGGVA